MKRWYFPLVFLFLGFQLYSKPIKEIPKERSISLMLPAKFQRRGGEQCYDFFNTGAIAINYCDDPTAAVIFSKHFIVMPKIQDNDNYCLSIGVGGSWVSQLAKNLGFGFGISYDLAGRIDGTGIGLLQGFSWEDFGILAIFHLVPSQSRFEASNAYVKKARVLKNKGTLEAALEILLKAWRSNPENEEALTEIHKTIKSLNKPEVYIKVAKQAFKLKRSDIAENLLDIAIEKNPSPKQIKEIEIIEKDIKIKNKKLKNMEQIDKELK